MRVFMHRWLPVAPLLAAILSCGPVGGEPPTGALGGPCYPNATCDPGLECQEGTCVEPEPCVPQATQPCTCADQSTGTQVCDANGQWSTCSCARCGDSVVDPGELCDGAALGNATCTSQVGLPYGELSCNADCLGFDTSGCHGCGNGVIDSGEVCDGTAVGSATCASESSAPYGDLGCNADCTAFDTSGCNTCGDDVIQTGEACDGDNLGTATCEGLGLGPGTLLCAADCTLDDSLCGPAPLAEILELCAADGDCDMGLFCREVTQGGTQRCVPDCTATSQCPSGMRCLDDGSGSTYCLSSDIGKACTQASQCHFACLLANSYCTLPCTDGHDCPNGYGCMPVGTPAQNVCVRAEAYCESGNTGNCIAAAACDLGTNMILGGCTTVCTTAADCPQRALPQTPWTCDTGGICRRPADVYGSLPGGYTPTEYHCDASLNPVNLCNDAQHMNFTQFTVPTPPTVDCYSQYTTVGVTGDACVNSCRNQGGCVDGYACVAVGGVNGQRIGLCLPTGTLEVGASCTSGPQCASGYCYNNVCSRDCTFDGVCPYGLSCVAGGTPTVEGQTFMRCQ